MGAFFFPLVKADAAKRLIYLRGAAEELDRAGEIMDYATAKPQFMEWSGRFERVTKGLSKGNVRSMHNPRHVAGKVVEMTFNDAEKAVDFVFKVVDDTDWKKVEDGVYTGASIGGGYLKKWKDPATGATRYTPRLSEISLVDSPCIPSATIMELQKADGEIVEVPLVGGAPRTFAQLAEPRTFGQLEKLHIPGVSPVFRGLQNIGGYAGRKIGTRAGRMVGRGLARRMTAKTTGITLHQANGFEQAMGGELGHHWGNVGSKVGRVAVPVGTIYGAYKLAGRKKQDAPADAAAAKADIIADLRKAAPAAGRRALAKQRWHKEGHKPFGKHLSPQHEANTWDAVADAQAAYDQVRPHLGKADGLCVEVPHHGGLLYNPDRVGDHDFDKQGAPMRSIHLLHASEASDWLAKYGPGARGNNVAKRAPSIVSHISELVIGG